MNYLLESLGLREILSSAGSALADVFYIKIKPAAYSLTRKGASILARRVPSNKGLFAPFQSNSGILGIIEQIERLSQDSPFSYELYVTIQGDILRNKLGTSELEKIYDGKANRFLDKTISYSAENVFKIGLNLRTLQDYVNEVYQTRLDPDLKELFPLYGLQPKYVKDLSKDKTSFLRIILDIMGKADVMQMNSREKMEFYTNIRNKIFDVKMEERQEANWYNLEVLTKMVSVFQREGNYDKVIREMYNDLVQTGKIQWFIEYPSLKKYKLANDQTKLYFNSTSFNTTNPYVEKWDLIDKAFEENQPSLIGSLGERAKNLGFKGFIGGLLNPMLIGAIALGGIKLAKNILGHRRLDRIEGVIEEEARLHQENERLQLENNRQQNRNLNALRDMILIQGIRFLDWMGNNHFGGGYLRNDVYQIAQGLVNQIDMIQNQNDNNILENINALIDDDLPFANNRNVRQRRNTFANDQMPFLPPPQEPQRILPPPQPRPRMPTPPPQEPRPRMPTPPPPEEIHPLFTFNEPQNNLQRRSAMFSFEPNSNSTKNAKAFSISSSALDPNTFDLKTFNDYLLQLRDKDQKKQVYRIAANNAAEHQDLKGSIYAARAAIARYEGRQMKITGRHDDQYYDLTNPINFFDALPDGKTDAPPDGKTEIFGNLGEDEDGRLFIAPLPQEPEDPNGLPLLDSEKNYLRELGIDPEKIQGMDFIFALNNYLALLDNTMNRYERMGGRMNRIWSKLTQKKYYQVFYFLIFSRGMLILLLSNLAGKL